MNSPLAGKGAAFHDPALEQAQFLFMSSHCSIRAKGIFERIVQPLNPALHQAGSSHPGDERFHQQLRDAMSRARACGIANPIVIGAIPFDVSKPSCLAIPRSYEVFSRELEGLPVDDTNVSDPLDVVGLQSLPGDQRFKQSVQQAIANFQLSDIRKAVLSRVLEVELAEPLDTDAIFARLVTQNPSAYQFRLPLESGAELIGASPELLLRKQGAQVYSYPLAGSAKRQSDPEQDRKVSETLLQSGKDAYEHSLVIDDIRQQLAPLCKTLDVPSAPSLMSTRAMWHLATSIKGELVDPSLTALQVASRLHPTPAVCGFPTRQARKLINLVESFERDMFTGMVGWCDSEGNGEWVVTIRCGVIEQNRIRLFAGAGIVEESCPESEWAETQAKLQTMLNALGVDISKPVAANAKIDLNKGVQTRKDAVAEETE
ncbi:MAG: isochorismate synthase [Cellvibrio sp.]|uniref:isochorismate synthase n=1 Tax=Cellvibrio sp. TaxID=1965322 RepID=UPI0031AEE108